MCVLILAGTSKADHSTDPQDGHILYVPMKNAFPAKSSEGRTGGTRNMTQAVASLGFSVTFKLYRKQKHLWRARSG